MPYSAKDYEILQNDLWKLRGWSVYHHWDTENENLIIFTIPYAFCFNPYNRNHPFVAAECPNLVDFKSSQHCWVTNKEVMNPSKFVKSLHAFSQTQHLRWEHQVEVSFQH